MKELVTLGEGETTGVIEAVRLGDWLGVLVGVTLGVTLFVALALAVAVLEKLIDGEMVADSLLDRVTEML